MSSHRGVSVSATALTNSHTTIMQIANAMVPRAQKEIKFTPEQEQKFWSKVDKSGGNDACWLWTAGKVNGGYGQFSLNGEVALSHRAAWIITNGQIPNDVSNGRILVCHRCDVPTCCNPNHLFLGTYSDNARDRENKNRGNHAKGDSNGSRKYPERLRRGESHGRAKLSATQVIEIRTRYAAGGIFHRELAAYFGVSTPLITDIIKRRRWKHI